MAIMKRKLLYKTILFALSCMTGVFTSIRDLLSEEFEFIFQDGIILVLIITVCVVAEKNKRVLLQDGIVLSGSFVLGNFVIGPILTRRDIFVHTDQIITNIINSIFTVCIILAIITVLKYYKLDKIGIFISCIPSGYCTLMMVSYIGIGNLWVTKIFNFVVFGITFILMNNKNGWKRAMIIGLIAILSVISRY